MKTFEAMTASYRENNGFQIDETELSIIITEFIIKMQLAASADQNYAESVAIGEYFKKVRDTQVEAPVKEHLELA